MASKNSIFEELTVAARGVFALLVGNRQASDYFDFSDRGLVTSLIGVLVVIGFESALPILLGAEGTGGLIFRTVASVVVVYALQVGAAALVLRQLKRLDGLVPFLVGYNWTYVVVTLALTVLVFLGAVGDFIVIGVVVVAFVTLVNNARLIVTLPPLQIVMFVIAWLFGGSIGLLLMSPLFPVPPGALSSPPV